jgi:hypothetical protein
MAWPMSMGKCWLMMETVKHGTTQNARGDVPRARPVDKDGTCMTSNALLGPQQQHIWRYHTITTALHCTADDVRSARVLRLI